MTRIRVAPMMPPNTVPMPPASEAPPITAAATACSSSPSPIEGSGEPSRSTWIMPAKPASTEHSMKQAILTRAVGMPIASRGRQEAAGRLDPVAEIGARQHQRGQGPRSPTNQRNDIAEQVARADDRR